MKFFEPDQVRATVSGVWLTRHDDLAPATGVSTDSRSIRPGEIFVALRGERTDGHAYLKDAAALGARLAIVEGSPGEGPAPLPLVRVSDTRVALLRLGGAYRQSLRATRVIGVAGSNGKTTTTRLIHAVLSPTLRGVCPPRSFNNEIGVPLTILTARPADRFLICEIGTNAPGEIARLSRVVRPDVAVITSIGREHLRGLGSLRGVAREEAAVLAEVRAGGLAIVTADAPVLSEFIPPGLKVVTFGVSAQADVRVSDIRTTPEGTRFRLNGREEWHVPLAGAHNALNAGAAIAVARHFGIDGARIASGLGAASGAEMRMQRVVVGGMEVYNDAYNANPESMLAAVAALASLGGARPGSRRVAVLGDMLELGDEGPALHREIADALIEQEAADLVVCVGPLMRHLAQRLGERWPASRVRWVEDLGAENMAAISALLLPGDLVLLKGSRGMALERVLRHVQAAGPARARAEAV